MSFDDSRANQGELFDPRAHQGHLLVLRVFDEVSPVITKYCPTGYNNNGYPNNAVRCAIADLDELGDDGLLGKIYPEVMIFTGLLVKSLKRDIGRKILVVWRQEDPTDKSSPYTIFEMKGNEKALSMGMDFLNRHPEFDQISPPPEWKFDEHRQQMQQQQGQQPQYGPQGQTRNGGGGAQNWGQHDRPHDRQPQQQRQQDPWGQQDPWTQQRPGQGPGGSYNGDQQSNGSFLSQAQNTNHWGQGQPEEAPF